MTTTNMITIGEIVKAKAEEVMKALDPHIEDIEDIENDISINDYNVASAKEFKAKILHDNKAWDMKELHLRFYSGGNHTRNWKAYRKSQFKTIIA